MISELSSKMNTGVNTVASPPPIGKVTTEKNAHKSSTSSLLSTPADTDTVTLNTGTLDAVKTEAGNGTNKYATDSIDGAKVAGLSLVKAQARMKVEHYSAAIRAIVKLNGGKLDPSGRTVYKVSWEDVEKAFDFNNATLYNNHIGTLEAESLKYLKRIWRSRSNSDEGPSFDQLAAKEKGDGLSINLSSFGVNQQVNIINGANVLSDQDLWKAAKDGDMLYYDRPDEPIE